ncbi:jerky protein homolog-like [Bactrocera tryoni]|uniref:jerky protein homolog-like n=1 Tax=Bactrocera tryoni TaxID=59916 RepID=UPI001A96918C|nr:jerky protein homolog-like [Bactrocera tryoni]
MTMALFEEWFYKTFVPEVKEFLRGENLPEKAILLLDTALCHPKERELKSTDGQILIMCPPPDCTAVIQPMDQNVIRLTKMNYKTSLLGHIVRRGKSVNETLKSISLKDAIYFLSKAWNALNVSSIPSSFQKLFDITTEWNNEDNIPLSELRLQLAENASKIHPISSLLQEPLQKKSNSEIDQCIVEPILESMKFTVLMMITLLRVKKQTT